MPYKRIASLRLGTRAVNCLLAEKIEYVHQLAELSAYELMRIPNFGKKCLEEVEEGLGRQGRKLSPFNRNTKVAPEVPVPTPAAILKPPTWVYIAIVHHPESDPFKSERVYFNLNLSQVEAVQKGSHGRGPLSRLWTRWRVLVLKQPQPVVSWLEWRWLSKQGELGFETVSHCQFEFSKKLAEKRRRIGSIP